MLREGKKVLTVRRHLLYTRRTQAHASTQTKSTTLLPMKIITSFLITFALASSAFAGPTTYSSKGVAPVTPAPIGCDCFAPGAAIGINGTGIIFNGDGDDDALGGGVL